MAIRINQGTAPQYGRVTMPKGTFLSSPSTAANGLTNGAQGMNPPQLNTGPVSSVPTSAPTVGGNPFLQTPSGQATWQQATNPNETIWNIAKEWLTGTGRYGGNPDPLLRSILNPEEPRTSLLNTPTPSSTSSSFVGREPSSNPNYLPESDIAAIIPGASATEKHAVLRQMGYVRVYQAGVGHVWINTGGGSPEEAVRAAMQGQVDARGRPQYVDPTSLEPGERVTSASGLTFVGGTPYTNAAGTTVAQYAMTIPDNIGEDTKGRYKWATSVRQDEDGNWVRVYQRKLRKVYSRSHRKKQQQRAEENPQVSVTLNSVSQGEMSQLVNLRADFG